MKSLLSVFVIYDSCSVIKIGAGNIILCSASHFLASNGEEYDMNTELADYVSVLVKNLLKNF
jgi:hypothetical protein